MRIALSGDLATHRIDELCATLEPLNYLSKPSQVVIDLSNLQEISAPALALLIATFRAIYLDGTCDPLAHFLPPRMPIPLLWLSETNLRQLLVKSAGTGVNNEKLSSGFHGCEPFDDQDGVARAITSLQISLAEQIKLPLSAHRAIAGMLWDLTQNVLQHADSSGGVVTMRPYSENNRVEFAVADRGIGVRRSLAKNQEYEDLRDDLVALRTALGPGVTGEPGTGKGMGLYLTRLVLSENEGTWMIRSGTARLLDPLLADGSNHLSHLKGTLVTTTIRLDRQLDREVVNKLLERPSGVVSGEDASLL